MNHKTIKLRGMTRSMDVAIAGEVRTAPDGTKSVRVAISSEYPVFRDWSAGPGYEVLEHTNQAIDLSMIRNAGPFCVEHNVLNQVGVMSNVTLDPDNVLRGDVRFSRSPEGQNALNDIVDGIRPHISVGYAIKKLKIERTNDGNTTYRVTSWMPYEVSTVSIPADPTVGVGRSGASADEEYEVEIEDETPEGRMTKLQSRLAEVLNEIHAETNRSEADPTETDTEVNEDEDEEDDDVSEADDANADTADEVDDEEVNENERGLASDEQKADRQQEIETMKDNVTTSVTSATNDDVTAIRNNATEIAKLANEHGFNNRTAEWLESGRSAESIAKEILAMKSNTRAIETADPVVLTEKESKEYSVVRAMLNAANGRRDGFEFEVSDEIAKRTGRETLGFFVPTNMNNVSRTALDSKTAGTGAENVFTEAGQFIDLLRAKTQIIKLGANVISGLTSKIAMPRQTATAGGQWISENGSGASQVNMTFDQVTLSPRTLCAPQAYTKQLLMIGTYDVEQLVRNDIAQAFAVLFDAAAINGGGTNDPLGILGTAGIASASLGTSGSAITYASVIALESAIANANADVSTMAYLTTPKVRGALKTTLKNPSGTASDFVWSDGDKVNGYTAAISTNVPSNLTKNSATNLHAVIFGDFSALTLAEFGAMEFIVDPYASKNKGMIELTGLMYGDVAVRTPGSFAVLKDVVVS